MFVNPAFSNHDLDNAMVKDRSAPHAPAIGNQERNFNRAGGSSDIAGYVVFLVPVLAGLCVSVKILTRYRLMRASSSLSIIGLGVSLR